MATAASSNGDTNVRETRRRRIVERGSDRFALITGRIQTLPSESGHSRSATCPPSITDNPHPPFQPSDLSPVDSSQNEDKGPTSFSEHDSVSETGQRTGPYMRKCETSIGASKVPALDLDRNNQLSQVSSIVQTPQLSASKEEHHSEPQTRHYKFCTPNEISSAVMASESVRTYCALAAAILVVLSYIGFPILGSNIIKSVIFFRPLYLLILTDISIVVAHILSQKQRGLEKTEQQSSSVPSLGGYGLADQLGDALEIGLVLQKVMGALFMDSSIYSVVVVCGLSMAKGLGW